MAHKQRYQRKTSSPSILLAHHLFPTSFTPCCFSVYWLRQSTLHVAMLFILTICSPVLEKESYKVLVYKTDPFFIYSKKDYCVSEWRAASVSVLVMLTLALAVNLSSATLFVLTLSFALFSLFHFTVFPPICHVERTCRQNRTECGTVVYLNPLMGSMGFVELLEHWFKASSICQFNKPEAREHANTLHVSSFHRYLWSHFECCIK